MIIFAIILARSTWCSEINWLLYDLPYFGIIELLQGPDTMMPFAKAKQLCDEAGGKLPVPLNEERNVDVSMLTRLLDTPPERMTKATQDDLIGKLNTTKVWMGIERNNATLYWRNMYTSQNLTWTFWATAYDRTDPENPVVKHFPTFCQSVYIKSNSTFGYANTYMVNHCFCSFSKRNVISDKKMTFVQCAAFCDEFKQGKRNDFTSVTDEWNLTEYWSAYHRDNLTDGWRQSPFLPNTLPNGDQIELEQPNAAYAVLGLVHFKTTLCSFLKLFSLSKSGKWRNRQMHEKARMLCYRDPTESNMAETRRQTIMVTSFCILGVFGVTIMYLVFAMNKTFTVELCLTTFKDCTFQGMLPMSSC